jgi:sulfite exporter TauE/SafE
MIWSALIIGFAGSLHCLGMCSPLAMAVTSRSAAGLLNRAVYNLGRIITYGCIGSIVASFGLFFPMVNYQNLISILLGVSLLVIGLTGFSAIRVPFLTSSLGKFSVFLKQLFARFLYHKNYRSTFLLGSLNGVLPCGLSFLALTYCLTLGGPVDGFFFMLWFGLGTLPVMLGMTSIFNWLLNRFKFDINKLTTGMLILSGTLLIVRVFVLHLSHEQTSPKEVIDIVLCR